MLAAQALRGAVRRRWLSSTTSGPGGPLRLGGVPEHFNYPIRLAAANGTFAWGEYPGGSGDLGTALREGELDVAIMLTEAATLLAHQNSLKIVGAYTTTPLVWGVHASTSRREPVSLVDATYGVSRYGSGSHLMALVDARQRRAAPPRFEVVASLEGARAALRGGAADVFMWEKFTTKPLVDSGEWARVAEVPTPWPCFAVVATTAACRERAGDIGDALRRIHGQALRMPDLAEEIALAYGQQVDDVRDWLKTVQWSTGLRMPRSILDKTSDALVDANLVDPVDLRDYADLVSDFTRDEALDAPQPEFLNIELQNVDDAPVSRKEPRSKTAAHLT